MEVLILTVLTWATGKHSRARYRDRMPRTLLLVDSCSGNARG
jgi:hypothetical protein